MKKMINDLKKAKENGNVNEIHFNNIKMFINIIYLYDKNKNEIGARLKLKELKHKNNIEIDLNTKDLNNYLIKTYIDNMNIENYEVINIGKNNIIILKKINDNYIEEKIISIDDISL